MNNTSQDEAIKTCSKCQESKLISNFYKSKSGLYGVSSVCKICRNQDRAVWAKRNKVERTRVDQAYHSLNKEKRLAANKKWREENKDIRRSKHRQWREQNKDLVAVYNNRHRALKAQAEGTHSLEEWRKVCKEYGGKCLCCERSDVRLTRDHIIPLAKGGSDWISNIQPLCRSCNSAKGSKTIDYRS